MDEAIGFLRVTNRTGERFTARFHGVDYEFDDQPVDLPVEAAAHIFGFGMDDKVRALHRLGWLTSGQQLAAAMAKLAQVGFEPVQQIFEIKQRRSQVSSAPSPGKAEAAAGEDLASSPPKFKGR